MRDRLRKSFAAAVARRPLQEVIKEVDDLIGNKRCDFSQLVAYLGSDIRLWESRIFASEQLQRAFWCSEAAQLLRSEWDELKKEKEPELNKNKTRLRGFPRFKTPASQTTPGPSTQAPPPARPADQTGSDPSIQDCIVVSTDHEPHN